MVGSKFVACHPSIIFYNFLFAISIQYFRKNVIFFRMDVTHKISGRASTSSTSFPVPTAAQEVEARPIPFTPVVEPKWNWKQWPIPFICKLGIFVHCRDFQIMVQ
jgi:hypothetical protein